jgi:hypothetical protein
MCFFAKHFQIRKADRPMSVVGSVASAGAGPNSANTPRMISAEGPFGHSYWLQSVGHKDTRRNQPSSGPSEAR